MPGRAILAVGAIVAFTVTGCFGTAHKSASTSATVRSESVTPMPPIYPGTTVSIPPPTSSSSAASSSAAPGGAARTIPRDGTYKVGVDIEPGTYRSEGGESCYWERLRGLGGTIADTIANGAGSWPQVVQIAPSDVAFKTQHCPTWTLQPPGAATTTAPLSPPVALPPGAKVCPTATGPSGSFTQSAVGSSDTSCPFAEQVRLAYGASGSPSSTPRQIEAVSPTTGRSYTMTCAADARLVTCTGGDGAVVYVY
jgi:hypothetical protein